MTQDTPYNQLPDEAFWKKCSEDAEFLSFKLYQPKFSITPDMGIVTAGSCFAQRFTPHFKASNTKFLDVEPAPKHLSKKHQVENGYGIYSARYGNIYTTRHLRQLLEEAFGVEDYQPIIWPKNGGYIDAMRPTIEAQPFASKDEVIHFREQHLRRLRELFTQADLLFFTLSLTESWRDKETGRVFPTFPGVFPDIYDENKHEFYNASYEDAKDDLERAIAILREQNPKIKFLFNVSPVGLVASNSGHHVLSATMDAKSKLRAIAGAVSEKYDYVDYLPVYELIMAHVFGKNLFETGQRHVSAEGISLAMAMFFLAHEELEIPSSVFVNDQIESNDFNEEKEPTEENKKDLFLCQEELMGAFS